MESSLEIQKEIYKLIRYGLSKDAIKRTLSSKSNNVLLIEESVDRVCDDYPDYNLIQFFMESKIIVNRDSDDSKLYMYHPRTKKLRTIDRSRLTAIISPKLDWSHRRYTCNFVYDPFIPYRINEISEEWRYNVYEPPEWQVPYFESAGKIKIPEVKKIPKIYGRFFEHLDY